MRSSFAKASEDREGEKVRADLTDNFITAMQAAARSPRLLAVFHFNKAGDIYISDQALGAADGLDDEYDALVEDWGDLVDSGDPMDPYTSEIRQMTITLWDGGTTPFSNYFLEEDPENILVDVYQWFTGLAEADKALIDTFVCQDPIESDEVSRLLRIDLVSLPMRYDAPLGDVLRKADWPNARESDLGKYIPLVIGTPNGYFPMLCAKTAPKATLNGSILAGSMTVTAYEDLDEEAFSATGAIQIGAERMTYSSRSSSAFNISQRGADGTTAVEHLDREEIQQHITDFTYLVSRGPISAIPGVHVAGIPAPASIYTSYPALNPARIVFSEKPYAISYAKGSTFLEMQFDAVNEAANNALQPYWAFDEAAKTSAARISESNTLLAIQQKTVNPDRGQIVKAYLAVEHWEDGAALQHDRAKVSIVGVGDLGYLSRPNDYDDLTLDAEVDIDHGHSHVISGEHTHVFSDPNYQTDEDPHAHASSGLSSTTRRHANQQVSFALNVDDIKSCTVQGPSSYDIAVLHFKTSPNYGCRFRIGGGAWTYGGSGDSFIAISPPAGTITISFMRKEGWGGSGTMVAYEIYVDYTTGTSVQPAYTGVGLLKLDSGSSADNTDKDLADVDDLATSNVSLEVNESGLPTRTVVNLFDITNYVNFDWGWFTDKEIRVEYEGTVDNKTVFVLHAFFDIEFRKEERIFSDEVTVKVVGLIDDGDGTYTGTAYAVITRPGHVRKYALMACGGLASDKINIASFSAAGSRYATEGYTFNGVLPGDMTVREAEVKLARQCRSRFFWDAGGAFIKFRELHADWSIDKTLTQASADIRLKGMEHRRKNVMDIINRIDLHYNRDWTNSDTGVDGYKAVAPAQNNESISGHGIKENQDQFMFDLVTDSTMAQDLADFYKEDGKPSQFYTIEAFLPYFDLQKEDHLRLTHDFKTLKKAAMRIASIERIFGSGKLKRMNLLRIVAESWYRLIQVAKQDQVKVADILNIEMVMGLDFTTGVGVSDTINFGFNHTESVSVADALAIIVTWVITATETVTCTDSLAAHMEIALGDTVKVNEFLDTLIGSGYGMGGYGTSQYGAMNFLDANPQDFVGVVDELVATLNAVFSDTVTCTDALIFSSGYGAPWADGDGYGETPYGG